MKVDQWLPAAHRGDAIGDEALRIRDALARSGSDAKIFALEIDEEMEGEVMAWCDRRRSDIVILHFALPSPLTSAFERESAARVLIYHNITPASFFRGLDDELARIAHHGREELRRLSGACDLALGDSEFNRLELEEMGFARTAVLPILLDFTPYLDTEPDPVLSEMLDDGRANFLFVGRVYPNKRFEDLAKLAFFYKKYVSENFRFLLVGKAGRMERYQHAVQALADEWGLRPSEFLFAGHLSFDELVACYRYSDLFITMSEHEGFAVPLVESMLLELPVMAYAAGAVPYTLGGAGIEFHEKNYEELAEMAHLLVSDEDLSRRVVAAGSRRVDSFHPNRVEKALLDYVEEVFR
ncbi:MAG TPA: glycosyltransferase family 4 protein [Vicinamibacteria bacterium]|nr:glycosyltransferase family 4 protein [Vicinamibacteria bacterium]